MVEVGLSGYPPPIDRDHREAGLSGYPPPINGVEWVPPPYKSKQVGLSGSPQLEGVENPKFVRIWGKP